MRWLLVVIVGVFLCGCCPKHPSEVTGNNCWKVTSGKWGIRKCCIDGQLFVYKPGPSEVMTQVLDSSGKPATCTPRIEK